MLDFEWYSEKERLITEKHGLDMKTIKKIFEDPFRIIQYDETHSGLGEYIMVKTKKGSGLSPEKVEQIKAAQKRHSVIDPGCEKLTPEEFINWHPVGGISWEERAHRMKTANKAKQSNAPIVNIPETQLAAISN